MPVSLYILTTMVSEISKTIFTTAQKAFIVFTLEYIQKLLLFSSVSSLNKTAIFWPKENTL